MTITIHQAICGELNKAWDLLRTTLPDIGAAKKIAFKSDLQDSPPSGISWQPVVRGFFFNEYYLIIKTYPDTSLNVRNGRVFSHCLIVSKSDLSLISDLRELFLLFKDEIDKTILLEPLLFNCENENKVILKDDLQLRFNKVIQGFSNLLNNSGTIIWVGQKYYEIALSKFWQLLSQTQKEMFNFGINFNPSEIPIEKLNFIVIPENIETKFENKGIYIVRKNDSVVLSDFSEQFLAGEENATTRLKTFIDSIELSQFSKKDIAIIIKGVPTFEGLEDTKDLKLLITLSNIVAKYSPNEKKGASFKKRLIERICIVMSSASEVDILLLKNFQIKCFKNSEEKINQATHKWIDRFLFSEEENEKANFASILAQIYITDGNSWWIKCFKDKTNELLSHLNQKSVNIIWRWIICDIELLKRISKKIINSKKTEALFISSYSYDKCKFILKEVKKFAIENAWLRLHATIIKSEFDFSTALFEQLKVDLDLEYFEGIEIITYGVKHQEIVDFSVSTGDKRCISISGKLCHAQKALLKNIEITNSHWQDILLSSMNCSGAKDVEIIVNVPQSVIYELYDALVIDKAVNLELVETISKTVFANILSYPKRNEIWVKFPIHIKNNYLERTSAALLEAISKDETYDVPSDEELSFYIISNAISTFLYYNRMNVRAALLIFNAYPQLPEHILKDYISNFPGIIDAIDSAQLGKLIYSRKYVSIAYVISSKATSSNNFKYALVECYSLLDFISIALLKFSGIIDNVVITQDQWWDAFINISLKLYSGGPIENKIWKQAGGEEYDLLVRGTGKEIWIAALNKLRKNGCSGITVKKLVRKMSEEHSGNQELKTLRNLLEKI